MRDRTAAAAESVFLDCTSVLNPHPLLLRAGPCKHLNNTKAAQGTKKKKQQRDTMGFYSVMRSPDLGFLSLHSARPSWGTTGECVPVLRERNGKRAPKKCWEWRTCVRQRRRSCFFHPSASKNNRLYQSISLCAFTRVDSSLRAPAAALPSQSKPLGYVAAKNRQRFLAQSA